MSGGRARGLALALLVVGAALMLFAGGREWFSGRAAIGELPALTFHVSGRDLTPAVSAIGLLALAGAAVSLLVGTLLRRVVAVVVLIGALGALWACIDVVTHQRATTLPVIQRKLDASAGVRVDTLTMSGWPWVALVGAVLVVAGAALVLLTVGSWPQASKRYEDGVGTATGTTVPSAGPVGDAPSDETSDAMWKALDRGEDPTDQHPAP